MMTGMTIERRAGVGVLWGVIFCGLFLVGYMMAMRKPAGVVPQPAVDLPGVGRVIVGTHAAERHGEDSWAALEAAQTCGEACLYRCPGGKWYYMGRIGQRFFTVVGYEQRLATAFITGRDNSRRLVDDHCHSILSQVVGHDSMVGAY